jgi:hypothetical protein
VPVSTPNPRIPKKKQGPRPDTTLTATKVKKEARATPVPSTGDKKRKRDTIVVRDQEFHCLIIRYLILTILTLHQHSLQRNLVYVPYFCFLNFRPKLKKRVKPSKKKKVKTQNQLQR